MPAWIHGRAEHILAKNPSMPKSEAFAIATQQSHAVGKSPRSYGTVQGRVTAKAKYRTPGDDRKTANPGHLESPKMAADRSIEKKRQINTGAAIGGAGLLGGTAAQLGFMKILKSKPTEQDTSLFNELRRTSSTPVIDPSELEVKLHPAFSKIHPLASKYVRATEEAVGTAVREGLENNAAFFSGGKGGVINMGGAGGVPAVALGENMPKHPGILAHELGHAQIHGNRFGRVLQNKVTTRLGGMAGKFTAAGGVGAATGQSDNETVRRLGRWAPLIAGAPQIAYEGGASLLGLANMRRRGASSEQLRRAAGQLLPAWGTYVAPKLVGVGAAHAAQALTTPKR